MTLHHTEEFFDRIAHIAAIGYQKLYVVRWYPQSSHRIQLNELNLKTVDGRRENILTTPFESALIYRLKSY